MNKPKTKRNLGIKYINADIPDVHAVLPQGIRYTRKVPDTYDVAERARLAAKAMANLTHSDYDYEFFFCADIGHNPPYARVTVDAINCQYKYQEAMPLVRMVSGYSDQLEVDQRWKETTLQRIGPDGMAYWPLEGRAFSGLKESPDAGWMRPCYGDESKKQLCQPAFMARIISAMTLYHREDGDPRWLETIRKMIARLKELSGFEGDEAWIIPGGVAPGAKLTPDIKRPEWMYISHQGWMAQAVAQYAREHHDQEALDYACRLINFIIGPNGMFDENGAMTKFDHFHHHSQSIISLADLALITGKERYKEMAWKTWQWARGKGDHIAGFFPEGIRDENGKCHYAGRDVETAETCEIADMIAAGCKLADLGYDTWDDIERWVRNQFAENQMTDHQWIYNRIGKLRIAYQPKDAPWEFTDQVAERHVGAFAGWPLPNDFAWFKEDDPNAFEYQFQHCCLGNGSRALYYIWDHILTDQDGTLSVNLLLNRSDKTCDIDSFIPYVGRVDITMKALRKLRIHLPDWARPEDVTVTVDKQKREVIVEDRYVKVGHVAAGQIVSWECPLEEKQLEGVRIGHMTFQLIVKGWDIVKQTPEGKWNPFYQREHYRNKEVRFVERERFVAQSSPVRY